MGYRSDVAFRIEIQKDPEITVLQVLEVLKERLKIENELSLLDDTKISLNIDKTILTLHFDYVKWYATFREVQIVEKWYADICNAIRDECKEYNDDDESQLSLTDGKFVEITEDEKKIFNKIIGAQRIRLGAEYDDTNNHIVGDLSDPMYVYRSIDF